MKDKLNILLTKFLKWRIKNLSDKRFLAILSVFIGGVVGLVASLLKFLINFIEEGVREGILEDYQNFVYFIFPMFGIALVVLFVKYFADGRLTQGVPFVVYSIGKRKGFIKTLHTYGHVIASSLTVGFGGSVGLEGPSVVTGSALGSGISQIFHLNPKRKILLLGCGAAAAISALFNSPIAAVIFVLEIILVELKVAFMIPLLFASATSFIVSWIVSGQTAIFDKVELSKLEISDIPFYLILGGLTGLLSLYFNKVSAKLHTRFLKYKNQPWKKFYIAGGALSILLILFPTLYGEGYYTLKQLLNGDHSDILNGTIYASLPNFDQIDTESWALIIFLIGTIFLKVYATAFTKLAGGNGGVFAPAMFIGGVTGFVLAKLLNMLGANIPENNFTLVGMSGVAAGLMHAPLTAIFLIAEVTGGYELYIPLMIVVGISFGISYKYNKYSYFTKRLAKDGDLVAHNKDHTVLRGIDVIKVIEKDLVCVNDKQTIADLVEAISKSHRNIFPVLNDTGELKGVILLDDVRHLIFKPEKYTIPLSFIMHPAPAVIKHDESLDSVMELFDKTNAWNLPVEKEGKYYGFLSKSKIFSAYRKHLAKNDEDVF